MDIRENKQGYFTAKPNIDAVMINKVELDFSGRSAAW